MPRSRESFPPDPDDYESENIPQHEDEVEKKKKQDKKMSRREALGVMGGALGAGAAGLLGVVGGHEVGRQNGRIESVEELDGILKRNDDLEKNNRALREENERLRRQLRER